MRILYYDWDVFNGEDCRDAMMRLGHEVQVIKIDLRGGSYDMTPEVEQEFQSYFGKHDESGKRYYDLVYSFDYYPNISEVCQKYGVPYVSWVFDCPHYTLDSHTINNPVNHVYVFDKLLYAQMKSKGVETIGYSPLGVNAQRLSALCEKLDAETDGRIVYQHDVCFLGSLYDNEFNFYDQIKYLPPDLKGYIDAVIASQERFFGMDLFSDKNIITDDHMRRLREYIKFEDTGKYDIDYDKVVLDILRKKVTVNERHNILKEMGQYFDTVLYTGPGAKEIPGVCNLGTASYSERMPRVFRKSKINLNITLRSILSGIPLRVVDTLAAGGFLITGYQEEIAEYFQDGVDLVIAMTPEDMIKKTAYYLEHDDEREAIARNGQQKVLEGFAYTNLLPAILCIE